MSEFKACPVCQEESEQCLTCASYVVDGERIYYEKLKDFGATQDYELRFIQRIQKHRTTAFFHKGKLYIPSRQGRSVPLAIGLQWEAWQEQQAKVEELKASHHGEVIGHEVHFKKIKQERDELQTLYTQQGINMLKLQKRVDGALKETQYALQYVEGDMRGNHEFLQMAMIRTFKALEQALKGEG
ncbi:hypothetical protein QM277_07200 [Acinetobacter baumannii]|uniref:hypothetical protein n=1 Tax=Acinetobacter baumannii TaxID=470 RepID=UPI0024B851F4|nr:hypothetical protein [Acinetobacter baumannii]MDI9703108.1 hypothetical protein [Acinetobacter baumannii]MDI9807235.1 hypothetical protein [Acinetobacter baumannii]